jgi:RNA-directed DNA polymerase
MNVLNEKGLEFVLDRDNLNAAYRRVKANRGAAGIDGIGVDELAEHLRQHWPHLESKLQKGTYQPSPVKPVSITKPDGGVRMLGIPTTQDRFIQQALVRCLSEVFEPLFSDHSYGYRPNRSAHGAIRKAQEYVRDEERTWVVDVDISKFFDEVSHDVLMREVAREIENKDVLRLIGKYLRAGKLVEGKKVKHNGIGMPQGGPLCPLLANVYLTPLDRELESRGIRFVRYADDLTIYAKSLRSAERILESITRWIEQKLKLRVNRSKSGVRCPEEGSFLGFRFERGGRIAISSKSLKAFREKVRFFLDARRSQAWKMLIVEWKQFIQGWTQYYRLTEWSELRKLSKWCRRHVRKLCWQRWHNWKGRLNAFRRLGASTDHQRLAHSGRGAWRMSINHAVNAILPNKRLLEWGFITPFDLVAEPSR